MEKTRLLVTGGAGYIGSHMVRMLADEGFAVTVLDNLSRGHADAVDARAELVRADLGDRAALERIFRPGRFAAVLHFAALAYVGESVQKPAEYYRVNVGGTLNLLDAMAEVGLNRLVFSSTCATYGAPAQLPITEDAPQEPVNPYGRTKLTAEWTLRDRAAAGGLRAVALRYFNVAGLHPDGRLGERHEPETHLIPLVLLEARRVRDGGRPTETRLELFGSDYATRDGTAVRDYVHVWDLCRAHQLALLQILASDKPDWNVYNVGSEMGFSVREVVESARRATGQPIEIKVSARRAGDPPELIADSRRIRSQLGWKPNFTNLDEIVATAWRWFGR